jgi:hypothetical protein
MQSSEYLGGCEAQDPGRFIIYLKCGFQYRLLPARSGANRSRTKWGLTIEKELKLALAIRERTGYPKLNELGDSDAIKSWNVPWASELE